MKREHHSQLPSNPSFRSFSRFHFSGNYAWFHNIDELFHHAIYAIKITQPICSFLIHWISNVENNVKWYKWTFEACISLLQIVTHVNYVISCSFIWFHARASNVWKSFQSCLSIYFRGARFLVKHVRSSRVMDILYSFSWGFWKCEAFLNWSMLVDAQEVQKFHSLIDLNCRHYSFRHMLTIFGYFYEQSYQTYQYCSRPKKAKL